MAGREKTMNLTVGKPIRQIFFFSIPLVFGTIFQQLYSFADTVIVGRCIFPSFSCAWFCSGDLCGVWHTCCTELRRRREGRDAPVFLEWYVAVYFDRYDPCPCGDRAGRYTSDCYGDSGRTVFHVVSIYQMWDDSRLYRRYTLREAAQGFGDVLCQLKLTRIPRQDSQASLEQDPVCRNTCQYSL